MNKMLRNLIILLGVAAAVMVLVFVVVPKLPNPAGETPEPTSTVDPALLRLSDKTVDKVSEVTIRNDAQTYTVYKKDDKYVIKGQEDLELDQTNAGDVFYDVANVSAERLIEQNPADLSQYGLNPPLATATAVYTDGTTATFLLGNKLASGNTYYCMKQGDPRVVTVWQNYGSTYLGTIDSLLAKEKFTLTEEDVDFVKLVKNGNTVFEITSKGENSNISTVSQWQIVQPWKRAVNSEQLSTLMQGILGVSMDEVVEGNPADLGKYGLDKPVYDVTIAGADKTNELLVGSDKDDYYTYAKFADSPIVYTVSKSSLAFTGTTAYKLMDKMIMLVDISSAISVNFNGLGQQGSLIITQTPTKDDQGNPKLDGNGKQMYDQTFSMAGKQVDDKVARYYYRTCIGLQTHSMIPEGWQPTGEPPVAVLTYTRNADPTQIKIEFLSYDKDFYAVRANGDILFLIRQANVQEVADDLAKLKDGTLTVPD
jgi:hypothetical protein